MPASDPAPPAPTTLRRLGLAALLMTGAVFLSRLIGYARDAFVAAKFGVDARMDGYNAAFTIPDVLNYFLAGGTLSITFLPLYAKHLAEKDEREANHVFSIVGTLLVVTVVGGALVLELLARPFATLLNPRLDPAALEVCIHYTRILLPAQAFFFAGGLCSATLFARGRFGAAALAPLLYNVGIIAGGFLLGGRLGPEGLAWGALAGAAVGPFLIPAIDAYRQGARFRPVFAARHPAFVEWLLLTLPLMVGVSLVTADDWIVRYFAGGETGAITRLSYAKRLVAVPIAVAGQAIGQASMPFFARLFAEGKRDELAQTFARTARGAGIVAMLAAAGIIGLAEPLTDLLLRRGKFSPADVPATALYLAIFAAAVPLWALQGLAARAFYAARNTLTPMLAGTLITIASLPFYALAWRWGGPTGLAVASGIGILGHTAALLVLAPRLLPELRGAARPAVTGLGAGALCAVLAGAAAWGAARGAGALVPLVGHARDLVLIAAGGVAFLATVLLVAPRLGIDDLSRMWRRMSRRR